MDLCASCKSKVEDGAVRCLSCGSDLSLPGAFQQIMGWVLAGISVIPLSASIHTVAAGEYAPLIIGTGLFICGVALVLIARRRSARVEPRVIHGADLSSDQNHRDFPPS
jgi:hypothetical protein